MPSFSTLISDDACSDEVTPRSGEISQDQEQEERRERRRELNKRSAQKSYENKKKMRFDLEKENTELMEMQKQLLQEKSRLEETHSLLELMYKVMKHTCSNDSGSRCDIRRPGSSTRSASPSRKDKQLVITLNEGPLHMDHSSLELGATVEVGQQHSISSFDLSSSDDEVQIIKQPVEFRGKPSRRGHVGSVVAAF